MQARRSLLANDEHRAVLQGVGELAEPLKTAHALALVCLHQAAPGQLRPRDLLVLEEDLLVQLVVEPQQHLEHVEPHLRTLAHLARVAKLRRLRPLPALEKGPAQRDEVLRRGERPVKHLPDGRRLAMDLPPNGPVQPCVRARPVLQLRKLLRRPHHEARPVVVGRLRHRPLRHAEPVRQLPLRVVQPALAPLPLHEPWQHFLGQHLKQPLLFVGQKRALDALEKVVQRPHLPRTAQQAQLLLLPKPEQPLEPRLQEVPAVGEQKEQRIHHVAERRPLSPPPAGVAHQPVPLLVEQRQQLVADPLVPLLEPLRQRLHVQQV